MSAVGILREIHAERLDQKARWTDHHDDLHDAGELARAAASYCAGAPDPFWPFDPGDWKPRSPRENLIRAAALVVSEIERLDRLGVDRG